MLALLGLGPEPMPSRVVFARPGIRLRAYGERAVDTSPVVVCIPAPIKRAYIWDLLPPVSVIRRCVAAGLRVYLIEWCDPVGPARHYGLAEYADRLIADSLDAVFDETGESRAVLAGHSLGGTLAAIHASLAPERVRGLVLLEAPLQFGEAAGAFASLLAVAPRLAGNVDGGEPIPGSVLNLASIAAAPEAFLLDRWTDWVASLSDYGALRAHLCVERWTLDEYPMPGRLFSEVVETLYRQDRFRQGTLMVGDRRAALARLDLPLLVVIDRRSRVIPPSSAIPSPDLVAPHRVQVLRYLGDRGVALQHVGVLVGANAHRTLWPDIIRWARALSLTDQG